MQEACFWRRSLYREGGGRTAEWPVAGDYELWIRFAEHAELVVATALLGGFNYTGKNRSLLNGQSWQEEEVNAIRSRIPAPAAANG